MIYKQQCTTVLQLKFSGPSPKVRHSWNRILSLLLFSIGFALNLKNRSLLKRVRSISLGCPTMARGGMGDWIRDKYLFFLTTSAWNQV